MSIPGIQGPRGMVGLIGPTGPSFDVNKPILSEGIAYVAMMPSEEGQEIGKPNEYFDTITHDRNHLYTGGYDGITEVNSTSISIYNAQVGDPITNVKEIRGVTINSVDGNSIIIEVNTLIEDCIIFVGDSSNATIFDCTGATLTIRGCKIYTDSGFDFIKCFNSTIIFEDNSFTQTSNVVGGSITFVECNGSNIRSTNNVFNIMNTFFLYNIVGMSDVYDKINTIITYDNSVSLFIGPQVTQSDIDVCDIDVSSISTTPGTFSLNLNRTDDNIRGSKINFNLNASDSEAKLLNGLQNNTTLYGELIADSIHHNVSTTPSVNVQTKDSTLILQASIVVPQDQCFHGRILFFVSNVIATVSFVGSTIEGNPSFIIGINESARIQYDITSNDWKFIKRI